MEHYFPKGAVWKLLEGDETRGAGEEWTPKVKGREHDAVSEWGYWWKAYSWDNYLLSCPVCNRKWKLAYFPVLALLDRPDPLGLPHALRYATPLVAVVSVGVAAVVWRAAIRHYQGAGS